MVEITDTLHKVVCFAINLNRHKVSVVSSIRQVVPVESDWIKVFAVVTKLFDWTSKFVFVFCKNFDLLTADHCSC